MCFFPRQTCGLDQTAAPSFVSGSNPRLQKFRLHHAKKENKTNPEILLNISLQATSPAFSCPSVPAFCFCLHTCPLDTQSALPQHSAGNYSLRGYQWPPCLNMKGHFLLSSALPSWNFLANHGIRFLILPSPLDPPSLSLSLLIYQSQ